MTDKDFDAKRRELFALAAAASVAAVTPFTAQAVSETSGINPRNARAAGR